MADNKYSVAKKQWKKWNEIEQRCFIDLYESMVESPYLFLHPNQVIGTTSRMTPNEWRTTAWNAAWMAADLIRYNRKFNG